MENANGSLKLLIILAAFLSAPALAEKVNVDNFGSDDGGGIILYIQHDSPGDALEPN